MIQTFPRDQRQGEPLIVPIELQAASALNIFSFFVFGQSNPYSRWTATSLLFGPGGASGLDVEITRGAANRLDLAAGDSFRVPSDGELQFGSDVVLSRGAADRLDLAAGDTLSIRTAIQLRQATANYTVQWNDPAAARTLTVADPGADDTYTFNAATQTLASKTLTAPTVAATDWANANHAHAAANSGGLVTSVAALLATPAIVLGSAAAAGVATTIIRSDSTIAAFDTTAPTTSAVGDAAAVGTAAFAARRDHVHGREAFVTPAIVLGTVAGAGVATTPIRSDSTIVAFDTTAPADVDGSAAAVGTAAFAARRDHVHLFATTISGAHTFSGAITLSAAGTALTVNNNATVSGTATVGTLAATTINGAAMSGTFTGTPTFSGAITFSATAAFTSASPFSVANGQTLTVATAAQTVGPATLTIPDFAGVADTFAFTTLAQTLAGKTLSAPVFSGAYSFGGTPTFGATMAGASTFSGAITLSATTGNTLVVDTNVLVVDATNNRVGINVVTPLAPLHISHTTATEMLRASNTLDVTFANSIFNTFGAVGSDNYFGLRVNTGVASTQLEVIRFTGIGNVGIGTTIEFGSGALVVGLANATTVPTTNPTGGLVLYSEGGTFRVRSSAGIIFNSTQGAAVADATGGATIDAEARTAINALLARVRVHGLIA